MSESIYHYQWTEGDEILAGDTRFIESLFGLAFEVLTQPGRPVDVFRVWFYGAGNVPTEVTLRNFDMLAETWEFDRSLLRSLRVADELTDHKERLRKQREAFRAGEADSAQPTPGDIAYVQRRLHAGVSKAQAVKELRIAPLTRKGVRR